MFFVKTITRITSPQEFFYAIIQEKMYLDYAEQRRIHSTKMDPF